MNNTRKPVKRGGRSKIRCSTTQNCPVVTPTCFRLRGTRRELLFLLIALVVVTSPNCVLAMPLQTDYRVTGQLDYPPGMAEEQRHPVEELVPIIRQRIDPGGALGVRVRGLDSGQVEFIFRNTTPEEILRYWTRVSSTGKLVFRIVADTRRHPTLIQAAREQATQSGQAGVGDAVPVPDDPSLAGRWIGLSRELTTTGTGGKGPFKFPPRASHLLRNAATGEILAIDESVFQSTEWSGPAKKLADWCHQNGHEQVEILVVAPENGEQDVQGAHMERISEAFGPDGRPRINFRLSPEGGRRMFALTSQNLPVDGSYVMLGIIIDNQLVSAPRLTEVIRRDAVIEGKFTEEEIQNIAAMLQTGKLVVPLREEWVSIEEIPADQ